MIENNLLKKINLTINLKTEHMGTCRINTCSVKKFIHECLKKLLETKIVKFC